MHEDDAVVVIKRDYGLLTYMERAAMRNCDAAPLIFAFGLSYLAGFSGTVYSSVVL